MKKALSVMLLMAAALYIMMYVTATGFVTVGG